jgi:VanZ family protein
MIRSRHEAPAWPHKAFVAYVLFMLLLFLVPVPAGPLDGATHLDKVIHFSIFLAFALFWHLDSASGAARTLLATLLFAGAIEVLQGLLPYRDSDWWDLAAGAAGGVIGAVVVLWRAQQRRPAT